MYMVSPSGDSLNIRALMLMRLYGESHVIATPVLRICASLRRSLYPIKDVFSFGKSNCPVKFDSRVSRSFHPVVITL